MKLPESFILNLNTTYGKIGNTWVEQLPFHIEALSQKLKFRFIKPLPDLSYHFLAWVELNSTQEMVILKTGPQGAAIVPEACWLQSFHHATPHIVAIEPTLNAFLMQRLIPGDSLKTLVTQGDDESATRILCQTIVTLHSEDPKPLAQLSPDALAFYKPMAELLPAFSFLKGHIEDTMFDHLIHLFQALTKKSEMDVLLHGDLHHDNLLKDGSTWKVIDPHGYIGDTVSECSPMIFNPLGSFPTYRSLKQIIHTRLEILCEMLPFDPHRIKAWCFCRTLLSAAWDLEDFGKVFDNKLEIAKIIEAKI